MNIIMAFNNNNIIPDTNYRARMGKHLGGISSCMRCLIDTCLWSGSSRSLIFCEVTLHPSHIPGCLNYRESPTTAQFVTHGGRGPHFYLASFSSLALYSASQGTRHSLYLQTFVHTPKKNGAQFETFCFGSVRRILALSVIKLKENNT